MVGVPRLAVLETMVIHHHRLDTGVLQCNPSQRLYIEVRCKRVTPDGPLLAVAGIFSLVTSQQSEHMQGRR